MHCLKVSCAHALGFLLPSTAFLYHRLRWYYLGYYMCLNLTQHCQALSDVNVRCKNNTPLHLFPPLETKG